MNNPVQFVQMMRNPHEFMKQVMNNSELMKNPIAKNALEMYQKGDKDGINKLANNLCKEMNTTPENVIEEIKRRFN